MLWGPERPRCSSGGVSRAAKAEARGREERSHVVCLDLSPLLLPMVLSELSGCASRVERVFRFAGEQTLIMSSGGAGTDVLGGAVVLVNVKVGARGALKECNTVALRQYTRTPPQGNTIERDVLLQVMVLCYKGCRYRPPR